MDQQDIVRKAEAHVTALFNTTEHSKLVYHNYDHTRKVVVHVTEIAAHYHLIESDQYVLCMAAWFHDTGYLFVPPAVHEEKSVELMRAFMQQEAQDASIVQAVADCIAATKWPSHPANLLQEILVDADTYNLGTKEFEVTNEMVYKEEINNSGYISRQDWTIKTLRFLDKHHYYTNYCKEKLAERKKKNIKKVKQELKELNGLAKAADKSAPKKNEGEKLTDKGVQTMLRLTSANHMRLSDMADGKANILISVNAIIISVILSVLLRKLQVETYLTIPTIVFLTSSVITIVVAILATRPKVTEGIFDEQDIAARKTNLLFFGNFYKMPYDTYEASMKTMMADGEYLYSTLIKDIYQLGVVLARKYKLIRLAYNIFMFGIIISVVAFALAVLLNTSPDAVVTNAQGSPL